MKLPQIKTSCGNWEYIPWISHWGESRKKSHTYIRPYTDQHGTYLISTIRISEGVPSLLTGYSIFDGLSIDGLAHICCSLSDTLAKKRPLFDPLCDILGDDNPYSQQARGEFVCTVLSIADLLDFCTDYSLPAETVLGSSDLIKASINYGGNTASVLSALLRDHALCLELADIIREKLPRYSTRISFAKSTVSTFPIYTPVQSQKTTTEYLLSLFGTKESISSDIQNSVFYALEQATRQYAPSGESRNASAARKQHNIIDHMRTIASEYSEQSKWEPVSKIALSDDFSNIPSEMLDPCKIIDFINEQLTQEFYQLAMESESDAHNYFDAPFLYHSDHFGEYIPNKTDPTHNLGGIIPFSKYLEIRNDLPASGYGRVAAYLALVDSGCIVPEIQYTPGNSALYSICSVRE